MGGISARSRPWEPGPRVGRSCPIWPPRRTGTEELRPVWHLLRDGVAGRSSIKGFDLDFTHVADGNSVPHAGRVTADLRDYLALSVGRVTP